MIFRLFAFLAACSLVSAQTTGNAQGERVLENYVVQPQDVLRIEVYQEDDLTKEVRVSAEGTIIMPLIGTVDVAGMTVVDAQRLITELYDRDYLVNPQINILVLSYNEHRVYVHGQVNRPGPVLIPPEEEMTLSQAISGAGGLTRLAEASDIIVKRVDDAGRSQVIEVDFNEILRDPQAKDIRIYHDDNIYVRERIF